MNSFFFLSFFSLLVFSLELKLRIQQVDDSRLQFMEVIPAITEVQRNKNTR